MSKRTSEDINKKQAEGKITEQEIDRTRKFYIPYREGEELLGELHAFERAGGIWV